MKKVLIGSMALMTAAVLVWFTSRDVPVLQSDTREQAAADYGLSAEVEMSSAKGNQGKRVSAFGGNGKSEGSKADPAIESKIVKTGSLNLHAGNAEGFAEAKRFVRAQLAGSQAYIANENENGYGNELSATFVVRIPADKFDGFLAALEGGKFRVSNRSVSVSDVTENYFDLETSLKNKRLLLERYKSVLLQAKKVADILSINSSIETVTSEIDSLEGRFRYLKNQVAFSTLTVNLSATLPATTGIPNSFATDLGLAFSDGLSEFRAFLLGIASYWVFIGIGGGLVALSWLLWRRSRVRRLAFY